MPEESQINFVVNGTRYSLSEDVDPSTSLLEYLREHLNLRGTKSLCLEGGCGVCTVVVTIFDQEKKTNKTFNIQSCQTLIHSCDGWIITTIEQLGNSKKGYNRLQIALNHFYGTQCGYCTPGFIMTMHGLLQKSPNMTMAQIEKAFDGNICRCTGYRPILDAFKCFATDAPAQQKQQLADIEDVAKEICQKTGKSCNGSCSTNEECSKSTLNAPSKSFKKRFKNNATWFRPITVQETLKIVKDNKDKKNRIVAGNTGQGVFKDEGPFNVYIDISSVKELYITDNGISLKLGANTSLARCIQLFNDASKREGFHHLKELAKHWQIVANESVRNIGSVGGNLLMKHKHHEFCSDIFTTLAAIDTMLEVQSMSSKKEVCLKEFLEMDLSDSLLLSISIPKQPPNILVKTYKITPRAVNAHAYVNAAFKFHIDHEDGMRVVNMPSLVFGGINSTFVNAHKTAKYFVGKQMKNSKDISEAIEILGSEIDPDESPQNSSPQYRMKLAQCLLFKAILGFLEESVDKSIVNGANCLERPLSSGIQSFDENKDSWPIGKAIPKIESKAQIAGEAEYVDDIVPHPHELYGAFVQSTIGKGKIKSISLEQCLKYPGVVDFISAKDIPISKNSFVLSLCIGPDPVFASKEVAFYGQAVGLVIAKSRTIAREATKLVKVTYTDVQKPILTIDEAVKAGSFGKPFDFMTGSADPIKIGDTSAGLKKSQNVLEGEFSQEGQSHFTLEPLIARVVPKEDGYDVYSSTQWIAEAQKVVANILEVPANAINIEVRRVGGAYGGKATRSNLLTAAAAVAAKKVQKPVRIALTLSEHLTLVGGREPTQSKYKVGFSNSGILQAVELEIYGNSGHINNESATTDAAKHATNTYHCPNWKIQPYYTLTSTAACTWCRAPGITNGIALVENVLDHIATHLNLDPLIVRERNFFTKDKPEMVSPTSDLVLQNDIVPLLKKSSDFQNRKSQVQQFNRANRWNKKGIALIPIRYPIPYMALVTYNVQVVIYEHDGTVAITHGGIEMGQGINTKVAQVAAKTLGVPMDLIKIKPSDTFSGANSFASGGSMTSDLSSHGVKICCEKIKRRMDPIIKQTTAKDTEISWVELVKKCFFMQIDLCERYFTIGNEHPKGYNVWAAAVAEVEVDVLTGQYQILRADIIEDCGRSMSPYIDIGQIEGAFLMGVGFCTSEKVKYDPKTGEKLSNGSWEYKPPTALDIPIDFRITLLPNGDNETGVVRSKATGEPATCLSYVVVAALRQAIESARNDSGLTGWFQMDTPVTVEKVHLLCNTQTTHLKIN